jgi:coenzyme PQQ precursor peptide PqqA
MGIRADALDRLRLRHGWPVLDGSASRSQIDVERKCPTDDYASVYPENLMKLEWQKPVVTEQEVGLEVTSYLPAELDRS